MQRFTFLPPQPKFTDLIIPLLLYIYHKNIGHSNRHALHFLSLVLVPCLNDTPNTPNRTLFPTIVLFALLHDLICQATNLFLLPFHFGGQLPALLDKLYTFDSQIFYYFFQFLHKRKCFFILIYFWAH